MANESTQWLYGKLTGLGYNVGKTQEEFDNLMQTNPESRKWAYETASACGLNVGKDINEFTSLVSDATTPVAPVPAQTPGQPQQTPATVQPVTDSTAQNAAVKPTIETATQPEQPEGWTPTPMQQQAFQLQMDAANARMKKQNEAFEQRMEGMRKGNKPVAVMGEREINPQTGQLERAYYTTQGDRVATPMQQSQANTEYHTWWENNTEAGKRSKEQRLQHEFDDRLASLWQRHNHSEGENAAELAWSAAESAYNSALGRNRQNTNRLVNSFAMNSTDAAAFKQMETVDNFTDRLTTHDLDTLMDNAWGNLGEEGQRALIDDCYMMLRHRNPGVDELDLYNQAKEFARQQSDLRMYHLAVEKNLPKSNLEYFMRKIGDMNLVTNIGKGIAVNREKKTGDMAAYEAANEEYRQDGHTILDVAGVVTGFALDPTTWLSAGVGGAATRGAMWAGGRWLAGRGASAAVAQAASRQFATSMTGRVIGGVVGGSVNFGTFEGIKEMENQFAHGGKVATMDEDGNLLQEGRYVNEGYSASAVGEQALHGLIMGAAIGWLGPVTGNVSDKLVIGGGKLFGKEMSGISNAYGKAATRAGLYAGATVLEGTIFSVPEWLDGNRDGFDVWTDNMAMMAGFKAKHMLKSAGGVLGDLKASFDSPTNGSKNRLDFESRLRMRMDAPSYGGLALTKDEEAELQRYGYDLRSLVESAERTGNAKEGTLIAQNAPEIVSRLTDMVTDPRVSEAARAKMYYYATGRKLPESTIMRGEMFEDGNGGFIVESQGANGVITSRSFKNRKAADLELERINRQAELNSIELGERYQQTADFESRLQDACRTVAEENGWDMVEVYRVCEEARRNHQRGGDKQFDEVQQNILRKVTDAMGEFEETGVTDAIRVRINEKYGVDIDAAIRKESNRRTQAEQRAIDEYIGELIPNKAKANPVMDAEAEDITNQKLLTEDATDNPLRPEEPVDPRFEDDYDFVGGEPYKPAEQPIGRAVMKYQDRQVEVLSGRVVLTDDGTMVDKERSDASIVIRDIATGKVEMVAPEAILSYEDYTEGQYEVTSQPILSEEVPEAPVEPQPKYTSGQVKIRNSDGTETRGWLTGELDENGNNEYYVEGDLQHLHYASDNELDNILSEYIPDKPQQTQEAQPTAPKPEDPNRPKPDGVANVEDYDEGYSLAMKNVQEFSDEKLTSAINELRNGAETLTDFGRGLLEGYEYEQQRRTLAAQPAPDPNVGLNGPRHAFDDGAPGLPEVEYPSDINVQGETDPRAVVPKNAENVPNIGENAEIPTGNRDLGTESVPKPEDFVENVQQTADDGIIPIDPNIKPDENGNIAVPAAEAPQQEPTLLQGIPRDEKGEPVFELAESPEVGWDALVEFSEGDVATAKEIADTMAEEKRKAYEKAQKLKPKGKTPTEILASKKANAAQLAQAENEYNLWQRMAGVEQSRQNAIRSQQEAEARRLAAERAEAEKAEREAHQEATQQERLSKEEATDIIAKMEMSAVADPKIFLSPESWQNSFGLSNSIDTPLGKVKMGEGQYQKLVDKNRSAEFGMVVQTLQDPDVVFIEPSEAKEGQTTERGFSYVFVKTFIRDGKKFKYYTSVSVLKDGMEVSVSSHIASKTAILKKLQGMERAYTKETLLPNSSEWHLAEHPSDVPDLLPTQGKSEISDRKVTNSASDKQESGAESSAQPSDNKGEQTIQSAVDAASAEVNTEPTPAQIEAGNYKKGHVTIGEFDITIENPAGSTRKGVDANGKAWSTTMANAYGYIKGTEGVDGDHIDVFLHQDMDSWNGRKVYVVDQTNADGTFDEHKVMLGFNDKEEAMSAYLANYDATWAQTHPGIRISETNVEDFNKWVQSSNRKTKAFADYSTVSKVTEQPTQSSVIIGNGYKVEPKPYTNKQGKTLDTYLVTFDRDFSKEEKSALRAKAKAVKGWYDRERGGWMLRSAEDAKAFAEDVAGKSEDEVADEAPLSMSDMQKPTEAPVKKVDVGGVVDALKQKGETKLSDHAEPIEQPKPKKRRWISDEDADEFNSLRNDLRNHFGKGDDIVQESAEGYGKPQPKQMDAEVLRMGTRMTYLMMKGGLRSFSDYCEAMKDELPDIFDDMRPHLKSLYAAAQNLEEVIQLGWDEEMDDRKTIKAFDVYNFDKQGAKDIIATAQHTVDERASQQQTDHIIQTLKDQRNEQRKKEADETSADTEVVINKAEASADEIESQLEAATTEEDAERLSADIDKEIEEVNDQLALLGYYEADPVEKDFNEAYGYMRNAERKATQDAHSLATQLAADLGITIAPKDRVRKSKYGFGSKIARSNVAPAGGEVYITLPLSGEQSLSMTLRLEKNEPWLERGREDRYDEDLVLTGIMYRVENPNGGERYVTSNHNISPTATYDELLGAIRRLVRDYLPADVVKPATPLAPQPGEDMVDMAERVAKSKAPEKARIPDEQPMNDLFRGLFGEAGPKQDSAQFIKDMADMVERGESPFTVTPEVESELAMQREAENNSTTQKNNAHERTDLQPRPEEAGRGRQQPGFDEPLGESAKHEDERTDGGRVAQRGGEHTVSDTKRGARVSGQHQSERSVAQPQNTRNNHAERGVDYAPKGEKARIDANLAAIRLAKELLAAGATATPEQMAVLRKYSGWGGLGSAFNEGEAWRPNPVNKQLREVLTPEEYEAAVMSRNSAYYTPAPVIDAMWNIARALGFKGGNIVEGSAGIGNIIGLMPAEISERSDIQAVEIDNTTGGILSLLYPDAKVEIQGFEATRIANGSVDLAITNVPFVTGLHVMDESGDGDLSRKFRDIHDFCIAKNVRKLREGGIGIFITSSGTLDKSQKLRNWLTGDKEGCADVVGAFRLNNQTFGGTAATSDIIVVRKRVNGRKSANAIDVSTVSPVRTASFTDVKGKTKDLPLHINRYFIEHPEHMGGEMFFGFEQGDTYRPTSIGLFPTRTADQPARIAAWVKQLAEMDWRTEAVGRKDEPAAQINEALGEGVKEGSMIADSEGNLCVARMGHAVPLVLNKNKIKGRTKEECFKDYSEIKDALADVLNYQTEHDDDAGLKPLLARLNRAYDTFVQRYGNLNKNNNLAWLRNDVDFSSIVALETYSEKANKDGSKVKTYGKTDIFSRRVVEKESEPAPKNVKDGIIASLYKFGRIDPEYLSEQLGKSREDVKREIIESGLGFEEPMTGQIEVSYEYLSGNVREKLRQAREANETSGGAYEANVKALEAVVPMNIPAHLIEFALGSSWLEPQLYEKFIKERTGLDVKLTNAGGTWHMNEPYWTDTDMNKAMGIRSEMFDMLIPGHKIIEAAITNKTITVSKTVKDNDGSHTETDHAATTACATKVDEIRQDFKDWAREQMQADPALSMRMEEKYNEKFNNSVPKSIPDEFVPEHFGGAATMVGGNPFRLRSHQAKAVIRATTQPVLLAHEVGTGKTYTLITTAMEMRRLGTARKPMIVVQNATVGQFVASAKALYPNAKVLTLEDADRNAEGRKAFYAKIKFNDWDMIVVPQSVFERIPDSVERQTQFIQDKIEEKMRVLEQMKDADPSGRSQIVKAAEREIARLENEITQLANGEPTDKKKEKDAKKAAITRQNAEVKAKELLDRATDDVEDFDSMGIDAILVDEAHEYKHLGFATAMQRGVKGIDPSPSKKSQGVYLKVQAVLEKTGGKNVVFATGTPISNTAAEIWTFMRYLMPADEMRDYDIFYFDDFVRNFGNLQQMFEFKTNGKYEEVNRFAGYNNLPELVRIWSTVADTVLTREAGGVSDKIPQMEGDKAQDIFLPQTRALRSIMKYVKEELDKYDKMTGKKKKENSHIPLVMYGIAKAGAVDARLVQSDAEDEPNSKTNEAVRQTLRTLDESKEYKGTVAIFADNYQNKHSGFNLYEDIREKLIAAGVPEEQVVAMKSGMTVKKKLEIFNRVNTGEVRVVMGSTFTLGTGVNIQERLHTLIHLDAPNRPMDYTQRNGRILRQGNMHKEWGIPVRILRFGVEDSLDVTAYQRLKTKGAIADSIMNGKRLMANSMENRSLEEEQDLFGDITAQLSGSEYAMLKNQIEKEVRKLTAKYKAWKADQTYIHNRKRQIAGQNKAAETRIADNKAYLAKVEAATIGDITVGKLSFPSMEAMEDFFTEQNKKKAEMQERVRTSGYSSRPATSDLTISVGGFDFNIHTEISRETKQGQQGDLFYSAPAKMTYSCPELGIDAMPVKGNVVKNAVSIIMEDVVSGKDFRERIEAAERYVERNNAELQSISARDGVPFQHTEELAQAEAKLEEYEELMKKEMEAKEAKYAEMDKDVEAASNIELTEEDSEEAASELDADYLVENANFVSRYETQDGKTIRYTSENPESYSGLSDTDYSGENRGSDADGSRTGSDILQRQRSAALAAPHGGRLNRKAGEFCNVERVFTESGSFRFTSGEKIESADDVAFIFSALEDAAVEHTFAVYVKDGVPTVVELGMGSFNASLANSGPAYLAYTRIQPDEVYFVHNHPSGNLKCSAPDVRMLKQFQDMCDVPVYGVIINLKTGKYGTFDTDNNMGVGTKRIPTEEYPLTILKLDKQIFAPGYDPMAQPLVRGSQDVAAFVNSHRMGDRAKMSFLIISQSGGIVGNIHMPYKQVSPANVEKMAQYISERVIQFGGMSAIVYGDFSGENNRKSLQALRERMKQLGGVNLLDVMRIEGNFTFSAKDERILYEPDSEYGELAGDSVRYREMENIAGDVDSAEAKSGHAERMSKSFNTPVRLVNDIKELTHSNAGVQARMRRSAGFYDVRSGEVVVVVPNNGSVEDVAATIFHEVVAHKGLREMIGEENYDAFCDEVYDHLKDDLKKQVDEETTRRFMNEPGKGYEHHRRVAVDELFGRMAEKGFEDFTRAERSIWGKLKAKVLEAINKFLGALKLPKWVKLGDNELRYMLWRSHERLRGNSDYVDMARDAAKREELGLRRNEVVRDRKNADGHRTQKKVANINEARLDDLHPADDDHAAKIAKILDTAKSALTQVAQLYKPVRDPRGFITSLKEALSMTGGVSSSGYRSFELKDGRIVTLRISNHNINSENAQEEPVVSIVIKSRASRNSFVPAIGKTVDEYVYMKEEIRKASAGTLSKIAIGLAELLETGRYIDHTGLARENHSPEESFEYRFRDGETDDIWKDRSVGLEERKTNAAIRLSAKQSSDLTLRNDAMRVIGGNLTSLRKAMAAQRRFDQATVKRVADLARILMQNGYLSGLTSGEMQRLISAIKNSVGHEEIKESVQKIMDIMVGNQLRNGEAALRQLLSIRGSKVDARGVEVQGVLDVEGQRTMEVVKEAMSLTEDDITNRIAEALNRMSDPDQTIADDTAIEYAGLHMALDYVQNIANSQAEEKTLRDELKRAKEDKDAGRLTDDAYKQFVETTKDAIRKNKIERAEAYFNLVGRLSNSLRGSIENAKAFREAEKERVNKIHHHANSDMEGRPFTETGRRNAKGKVKKSDKALNALAATLFSPLGTFEQYCRSFGSKSVDGRGYLFEDFVVGMQECRDREWQDLERVEEKLNQKAAKTLGKKHAKWSDLRSLSREEAGVVTWWDGGEMRDHVVTQGQIMYIYMAEKMNDGRMKLRRMGITEDDIAEIENRLDPALKETADWIQDEFMVELRNEDINPTYKRINGASMAAIENYFPLKILGNALEKQEDMSNYVDNDGLPKTMTGSLIRRTVNSRPLDILNSDPIDIVIDHVREMIEWKNMAELRRDLGTLLSYKRFRNQIKNMGTIYGAGEQNWKHFKKCAMLVGGAYKPQADGFDKAVVNMTKLATAAVISFNFNSAIKQLLSYPAFAKDANMLRLLYNATPFRARACWTWAEQNMPAFRRRWKSRQGGNDVLREWDGDWGWTHSRFVERLQRAGLSLNAFIDALTVSMGSEAVYHNAYKQYIKDGFSSADAHRKSILDAEIVFNLSQQSSEVAYLSLLQNSRSVITLSFSNFRNSSMAYARQIVQAVRELYNMLSDKDKMIEFETKKAVREGLDEQQAKQRAKRKYNRQWAKAIMSLATFSFILPALWQYGLSGMWYSIFGDDEDKKKEYAMNAIKRGFVSGWAEGLAGGGTAPDLIYSMLQGEDFRFNEESSPASASFADMINAFGSGNKYKGVNDAVNFAISAGTSFRPQYIEDVIAAGMDFFGNDDKTRRDYYMFMMRILSVPQSQQDEIYLDELGLTDTEASRMTPSQLAERYAEYKVKRGNMFTLPLMSEDEYADAKDKWVNTFNKKMTERLESRGEAAVNEAYADFEERYKAVSKKVKRVEALMKKDYAEAAQAYAPLQQDPDWYLYKSFKRYDEKLSNLSHRWLAAKTPEEASQIAAAIHAYRAEMVKTLQAETAESQ